MKLGRWNINITKAAPLPTQPLLTQTSGNWWWPIIREPFIGAWQRNIELRTENVVTYFAVYSCISLISTDIGKLRLRLMQQDTNDIWRETTSPSFSPVLRRPNHFQTRGKFIESWMISKLLHGNTYVLKERDERNVVVRLYILDPVKTKPKVAPDGSVFYELNADNLSGLPLPVIVPASEIIHDVMVWLYHPLCGVSPLLAAAMSAAQGLGIQNQSTQFFNNGAQPGGVLSAPGIISADTAQRIKFEFEQATTGTNAGRMVVLGDGLKYEPMIIPAEESQLIEQLKWTAENVCAVFHVPPHMLGIGAVPNLGNVESLQQQYYSQCLQTHIEAIESLLDDGLGLAEAPQRYGTEFDLDDLIRMDTASKVETASDSIKAGFLSPNEARARFNMKPVKGGEVPLIQQQNWPLDVLAERPPPAMPGTGPAMLPAPDDEPDEDEEDAPDVERVLQLAAYRASRIDA